jgi:hypothetical protein
MFRIVAFMAAVSLSAVAHAQTRAEETSNTLRVPVMRWASYADFDRVPMNPWRWDNAEPQTGGAANSRLAGSRSKGKIALGLGLIGGGLALMIANPDTSEYMLTSSGNLVRRSYRVRLVGGIMAGGGGLILWSGLKSQR